jgi:hypothetical protein
MGNSAILVELDEERAYSEARRVDLEELSPYPTDLIRPSSPIHWPYSQDYAIKYESF